MKTKTAYAGVLSFSILGILQWLDGPFTFIYISFGIAAVFLLTALVLTIRHRSNENA
ncbi:hypothetical protein ACE1TH_15625 [Shouchella sp. JSM 1781072]|uniref:hypothetical protein n=1 Tax=Shouchella sp. JSM 1781072 TaxID=3344581 RepID=UPI0035BEB9DD